MNKGALFMPKYSNLLLKVNIIYPIYSSKRGNSTVILAPNAFEYLSNLVRDRLSYACSIRHTEAWDIPRRSAISCWVSPISSRRCLNISAIRPFNRSFNPGRLLCLYPGLKSIPPVRINLIRSIIPCQVKSVKSCKILDRLYQLGIKTIKFVLFFSGLLMIQEILQVLRGILK